MARRGTLYAAKAHAACPQGAGRRAERQVYGMERQADDPNVREDFWLEVGPPAAWTGTPAAETARRSGDASPDGRARGFTGAEQGTVYQPSAQAQAQWPVVPPLLDQTGPAPDRDKAPAAPRAEPGDLPGRQAWPADEKTE